MSKVTLILSAFLLVACAWAPVTGQQNSSDQQSQAIPALKLVPATKVDKAGAEKADRVQDSETANKNATAELPATHKQTGNLVPKHDGEKIPLHTFCLDGQGQILACVGGSVTEAVMVDGKYENKTTQSPAMIQIYSHEQKLLREIALGFTPTAINVDKSGNIYVAGDGQILKLNERGEKVKSASSPSLKDEKELRDEIKATLQKQYDEYIETADKQVERIQVKVDKILETAAEDRSKVQVRQLKSFEQQLEMYRANRSSMESFYKPSDERIEQSLKMAKDIKSIAVNDADLFVTCAAPGTYGYEIWRTDLNLENPARVLENVSGCCGQMDIQARGEHLYVAENTKFQVAIYDRDGKQVNKFGKRASDQSGFGSCCNPMNIRCCANGEVLAAESSIGNIKRYSADGELIGFIGRAKIGGGCKHVAIGHDTRHDIYYMMYQDEGSICVMKPAAQVGTTPAEAQAQIAAEGLGKKVIGEWTLVTGKKDDKQADDAKKPPQGAVFVNSLTAFKSMTFNDDGKFDYQLDSDIGVAWKMSFVPIKQEDNKLWVDLVDEDDIVMMTAVIEFKDDDQIQAEIKFGTVGGEKRSFSRK